MSDASPVITVRQEVEALLRSMHEQVANVFTNIDALVPSTTEFHDAVLDELDAIIERYVSEKADNQIRVGDTVRITQAYADLVTSHGPNKVGTEFVVTEVVASPWTALNGTERFFYVKGDPADNGIWDDFIEKVRA